jgi:hypothetical protein
MYAQVEKSKENRGRPVANAVAQKKSSLKQGFGFVDNRHEALVQRKLQEHKSSIFESRDLLSDSTTQRLSFNEDPAEFPIKKTKLATINLNTIQKTAKNVSDAIKNDKYPSLKKWYAELKKAVDGSGVTEALTIVVQEIFNIVREEDVSIQRAVYDDLKKLLNRYNNKNHRYPIKLSIVPSLPAREIQATSEYLSYPDSPSHNSMTQEEASRSFSQIFNESSTITLQDQQGRGQTIPVVDSFAKAGRAIRYQQYANETIAPIPFSVQQGDTHTLFEYRHDYVANPLRQREDAYRRDGQIGSWADIIKLIDSTTTIQNIINIINGNVTTQATQVQLEVAGAMVADTKNGIKNWITIMKGLPGGTTIKNLLNTEYAEFVDSRSYKTPKSFTGPETSLKMMEQEDTSMEEDILDDWPEQTANQVLLSRIGNVDELRLAAGQMAEAIETAVTIDPKLEEVTSDFISETVVVYARTISLNSELAEILDFLVAELVYGEDYTEALDDLRDNPKYSEYINALRG